MHDLGSARAEHHPSEKSELVSDPRIRRGLPSPGIEPRPSEQSTTVDVQAGPVAYDAGFTYDSSAYYDGGVFPPFEAGRSAAGDPVGGGGGREDDGVFAELLDDDHLLDDPLAKLPLEAVFDAKEEDDEGQVLEVIEAAPAIVPTMSPDHPLELATYREPPIPAVPPQRGGVRAAAKIVKHAGSVASVGASLLALVSPTASAILGAAAVTTTLVASLIEERETRAVEESGRVEGKSGRDD